MKLLLKQKLRGPFSLPGSLDVGDCEGNLVIPLKFYNGTFTLADLQAVSDALQAMDINFVECSHGYYNGYEDHEAAKFTAWVQWEHLRPFYYSLAESQTKMALRAAKDQENSKVSERRRLKDMAKRLGYTVVKTE